jgi:hypothetical protein
VAPDRDGEGVIPAVVESDPGPEPQLANQRLQNDRDDRQTRRVERG